MNNKMIFLISFLSLILLTLPSVLAQNFDLSVQPTTVSLFNCQSTSVSLTIKNNELLNGVNYKIYYENTFVTSGTLWPLGSASQSITVKAASPGTSQTTITRQIRVDASTVLGGGTSSKSVVVNVNSAPSDSETQASGDISTASSSVSSASTTISNAKTTINEAKSYNLDVSAANTYLSQAENSLTNAQSYYNQAQDSFNACRGDLTNFNDASSYATTAKGFSNNANSYASSAQSDAQNKINIYKAKLAASASISNAQNALTSAQSSITTAQNAISQAETVGKNVQDAKNLISSAISDFNKAKDLISNANSAFASEDYYNSKSYADNSIRYSDSAKDLADRAYSSAVGAPMPTTTEGVPTGAGGAIVQVSPTITTPVIGFTIILVIVGVGLFWYFKKTKSS
jgi:hypothetical protein